MFDAENSVSVNTNLDTNWQHSSSNSNCFDCNLSDNSLTNVYDNGNNSLHTATEIDPDVLANMTKNNLANDGVAASNVSDRDLLLGTNGNNCRVNNSGDQLFSNNYGRW